jgi:hypothetical protein
MAVYFLSEDASVTQVILRSSHDAVFSVMELEKTQEFKVEIYDSPKIKGLTKGLVLALGVEFEKVEGWLRFRSVGLEVAVTPPELVESIKFDTGCWNVTDIRSWEWPTQKTEGRVKFSTAFSSPPTVVVSMSSGDVGREAISESGSMQRTSVRTDSTSMPIPGETQTCTRAVCRGWR